MQRAQGCEDWDLYLRIARRFRFLCQPDCLNGYRRVHGSMSVDVEQMMRSYELMMSKLGPRGGGVPIWVHRWSRASYLLYLADRAAQARRVRLTARLLLQAISNDPVHVLDPRVVRALARSLLAGVLTRRPVTSSSNGPWDGLTLLSTRSIPVSAVLWSRVWQRRKRAIVSMQQRLAWPVRCEPDLPESAGAES